jgi:hypothetical protein
MGKSVVFWVVVVVAVVVLAMWSVLRASVKMKSGHISINGKSLYRHDVALDDWYGLSLSKVDRAIRQKGLSSLFLVVVSIDSFCVVLRSCSFPTFWCQHVKTDWYARRPSTLKGFACLTMLFQLWRKRRRPKCIPSMGGRNQEETIALPCWNQSRAPLHSFARNRHHAIMRNARY